MSRVRYPEGLCSAGIFSAVEHALSPRAYSTWRLTGYALSPSTFGQFDDPTAGAGWVVRQPNKGDRSRCGQDTRDFVVGQVIHDHSLPIALRMRRSPGKVLFAWVHTHLERESKLDVGASHLDVGFVDDDHLAVEGDLGIQGEDRLGSGKRNEFTWPIKQHRS